MAKTQFIVWNDEYSVKNEKLDSQHKKIFGMINELYAAMEERIESRVLRDIFEGLLEYVRTHFQDEERIQEECNYPDYDEHKAAHKRLTDDTLNLFEQFSKRAGTDIAFDLFNLLKGWWLGHIISMDKKYVPYILKARGKSGKTD